MKRLLLSLVATLCVVAVTYAIDAPAGFQGVIQYYNAAGGDTPADPTYYYGDASPTIDTYTSSWSGSGFICGDSFTAPSAGDISQICLRAGAASTVEYKIGLYEYSGATTIYDLHEGFTDNFDNTGDWNCQTLSTDLSVASGDKAYILYTFAATTGYQYDSTSTTGWWDSTTYANEMADPVDEVDGGVDIDACSVRLYFTET